MKKKDELFSHDLPEFDIGDLELAGVHEAIDGEGRIWSTKDNLDQAEFINIQMTATISLVDKDGNILASQGVAETGGDFWDMEGQRIEVAQEVRDRVSDQID